MAGGKLWTDEEKIILEQMYKDGCNIKDIKLKLGRTIGSINAMSSKMELSSKYMRNNNPNYKAEYQNYEWCYEKIVVEGKMPQDIAEETGYSRRVIEKWTREKYGLSNRTFKEYAQLTPIQYSLILAGTLGDGHIDKRENNPIYIESHAEDQMDYMFWKYNVLKNLCNSEPKYYKSCTRIFKGKQYKCQPSYRMETRTIYQLKSIRDMSRMYKIYALNELGFCTHLLDDGYRGDDSWQICFGDWTVEEEMAYLDFIDNNYGLKGSICKDTRYAKFNSNNSKIIDNMILKNIPNNLDIIKYKITERSA